MNLRSKKFIIIVILTLLVFSLSSGFQPVQAQSLEEQKEVQFHFIDAGQADATLIETSNTTQLIDAGYWQNTDVIDYLDGEGINQIDLVVGTHPHADHIGQMAEIIEDYNVEEAWMSGYEQDSQTYDDVCTAIEENNVTYRTPRANETYQHGSVEFEFINPPDPIDGMDIHESSLAFRTNFGDFSAMFTGDAETETEQEIIDRGHELETDVYQAGHHGSSTSSSADFLDGMDPDVAIYSADPEVYGHPHDEVVERMDERGIEQYRTYEHGTIQVTAWENGDYEISVEYGELDDEEYSLDVGVEGEGTTDPEASEQVYRAGEEVTLEAVPAEGWQFSGWTGYEESDDRNISFEMPAENVSITANFVEEYQLTVVVDGSAGLEIMGPGGEKMYGEGTYTFADGDTVKLSPVFDSKTSFEGWEVNGETREEETIEVTMDEDKTATLQTERVEESGEEICSFHFYSIGAILVGFALYGKSRR